MTYKIINYHPIDEEIFIKIYENENSLKKWRVRREIYKNIKKSSGYYEVIAGNIRLLFKNKKAYKIRYPDYLNFELRDEIGIINSKKDLDEILKQELKI